MATRSLGTLTLDLIARIGGFRSGMDQAARIAHSRGLEIDRTITRLGASLRGVFGTLSVGLIGAQFIQNTRDAQGALAQLNAVVKSTGGAAGQTVPELVRMSKEFQRTTAFADDAVQGMQAILLQFTRLSGDEFVEAQSAVLDIAARLGKDLQSAAILVGRALNDPIRGMTQLRRSGIAFSESQEKVIKSLVETGRVAEAQRLILAGLEKQFGGAATAQVTTLGGALTRLKNAFGDIFELDTGQTSGLIAAINALADNLETLGRIVIRVGILYAAFRASLIASEVITAAKNFATLFAAVASGRAVLASAAVAQAADTLAKQRAAVAAAEVTAAEVARTAAMVAGTRATVARVVADQASTASAAVRATVLRNAAGAEAALAAATAAHTAAVGKVAIGTTAAAAAQAKFASLTSRAGGAMALLLAPFKGLIAIIAANPLTALVVGLGAVVVGVTSFRDKLRELKQELDDPNTEESFSAPFRAVIRFGNLALDVIDSVKFNFRSIFGLLTEAEKAEKAIALTAFARGTDRSGAIFELTREIDARIAFFQSVLRAQDIDSDLDAELRRKIRKLAEFRNSLTPSISGGPLTRGRPQGLETPQVFDEDALEKIRSMVVALEQQNATFEKGETAVLRYRLEHGDLKQLFAEAGPEADQYRAVLLKLTSQYEALKKSSEAAKKTEEARGRLTELIDDLEEQIALFGKGERAAFEYRLEHGDLAEALALVGDEADPLREKLRALNEELQAREIADQIRDIRLAISEMRGETVEAITLRFDVDNEALRTALESAGDEAGISALDTLRKMTIGQAEFNRLREEAAKITESLATQEERIRNTQEVGAVNELQALKQLGSARAESVEQLNEILEAMEAIAAASGNPKLLQDAEKFRAEIEKLAQQTNLLAEKIESDFKSSFSSAFADVITGASSAKDAVRSFIDDMFRRLANLVAQNFAEQIFGGFSSGGFGAVGDFFTGLFGGSRDHGGRGTPGQAVLIGRGAQPELFMPDQPGTFVPNADALGGTIINHFNFTVPSPTGTISRQTQQQLASIAARAVADANRRNN